MIYQILNGDCLAEIFPVKEIPGEHIVCRECLIEGPVKADSMEEFFNNRSAYIQKTYSENKDKYISKVKNELKKIIDIPIGSDVILWFENDLFCQTNMWFIISLLKNNSVNVNLFRVFPEVKNPDDKWKGFGPADKESLVKSFSGRIPFSDQDIELGNNLWNAYSNSDLNYLKTLSVSRSKCFSDLKDVCKAHIERFPAWNKPGRPEQTLIKIISSEKKSFNSIFSEFNSEEGIYGFGDSQIKNMLKKFNFII